MNYERTFKGVKKTPQGVFGTFHFKDTGDFAYDTEYITCEGDPHNPYGTPNSLWGTVEHMREKMWWSKQLEADFISAVRVALHG